MVRGCRAVILLCILLCIRCLLRSACHIGLFSAKIGAILSAATKATALHAACVEGRFAAVQLIFNAFRHIHRIVNQRILVGRVGGAGLLEFLIGAEGSRVILHIGCNQAMDFRYQLGHVFLREIFLRNLLQIALIHGTIGFIFQKGCHQGLLAAAHGGHALRLLAAAWLTAALHIGVIGWLWLIICIRLRFGAFCGIGYGIIILRILPLISAAETAHALAGRLIDIHLAAAKAAEGKVHIPRDNGEIAVLLIEIIVMRGIAEVAVKVRQCHIRCNIFQRRFHIQQILQILAILKRLHQSDDFLAVRGILVCFQVQSCVGGNIIPVINQIRTCAILSFGLIKVARCIIKMGLKEGFIYCLHCQIQPPFLTVDGNVAVAALGDIQSKLAHDFIGNIFAHAAVVGIVVIQTKLFQAVIIAIIVIIIKIQLKAVPIGIGIGHRGQAGVALRANCHISDRFAVNRHIRLMVFLLQRVFQHILPVRLVNFNVDFIYRIILKDMLRVGMAFCRIRPADGAIRRHAKHNHQKPRKQNRFIFF